MVLSNRLSVADGFMEQSSWGPGAHGTKNQKLSVSLRKGQTYAFLDTLVCLFHRCLPKLGGLFTWWADQPIAPDPHIG